MGVYRELKVWQKSMNLVETIYSLTREGEISKDFGLRDQLRRSAVSIPSNIAEGDELKSDAQSIRHFYYSKGSSAELLTQLMICQRIGYIDGKTAGFLIASCEEISGMLNRLISHRSKIN